MLYPTAQQISVFFILCFCGIICGIVWLVFLLFLKKISKNLIKQCFLCVFLLFFLFFFYFLIIFIDNGNFRLVWFVVFFGVSFLSKILFEKLSRLCYNKLRKKYGRKKEKSHWYCFVLHNSTAGYCDCGSFICYFFAKLKCKIFTKKDRRFNQLSNFFNPLTTQKNWQSLPAFLWLWFVLAQRGGFEPSMPFSGTSVFETDTIDHSDISAFVIQLVLYHKSFKIASNCATKNLF